MSEEYYSIKWLDNNTAKRHSREVDIICTINKGGVFIKDGEPVLDVWTITLSGTGDTEHHLVEDSAILLKKIVEVKCGEGH
jgi:hypothetical protein